MKKINLTGQSLTYVLRSFLVLLVCYLFLSLSNRLLERISCSHAQSLRLERLQIKKKKLEQLLAKKIQWLALDDGKRPDAIAAALCDMPLCKQLLEDLIACARHPFLKDPASSSYLLSCLQENTIALSNVDGDYTLVRPVYMDEKDLEMMIQIIENEGAFSPVEIKELSFKRESVLGGELWRVERLIFGPVDAEGALPSSPA